MAALIMEKGLGSLASQQSSALNGDLLSLEFHEMFRSLPEPNRKKGEKKKSKKKSKITKVKEKRRGKNEGVSDAVVSLPPIVEMFGNPSTFAAYSGVRQSVMEKQIREATQIFLAANVSRFSDTDSEDDEEQGKSVHMRVPKIVGIGLCAVFELIRESRHTYPALCTRALHALFGTLQGQQPEGLKNEPNDTIESLFDLLMFLVTSRGADVSECELTSLACACLLSLVVARGDTGKLLSAVCAVLMSPSKLSLEEIEMPNILTSLQRSVHAVLLGKSFRPNWMMHGILKKCLIDSFPIRIFDEVKDLANSAIASDGRFLYIHTSNGLYKIGTGYGNTIKGTVIANSPDFFPNEKGWLGFASNKLFFKITSRKNNEIHLIDRETLKPFDLYALDGKDWGPNIMFSDGEFIGHITSAKDDSFVVRTFSPATNTMTCLSDLQLKLARKCLDVFGYASFDEDTTIHTISTGFDEEPGFVCAGKEFMLIRTNSGKIMYSGKQQSLGIKQSASSSSRWNELAITKSPKIIQHSTGHEGLHALLVSEDGGVFFVGTARRGEDGDQGKGRRQPKAVKPKKMIKMDGQQIVYTACNNGTSALVTKDGDVYMFGKDTAFCDHSTGIVTDLKDVHATQVAVGKAHVIVLSNEGKIYSFGINNKGQCGRDFASNHSKEVLGAGLFSVAMATAAEEECEEETLELEDSEIMCQPGRHKWKHDQCMVCTVCGECTGYGAGCISNGRPDRNPGLACGCGSGDSGCADCGCCRVCARENMDQDADVAIAEGSAGGLLNMKVRDMIRLDLIIKGRHGERLQNQLRRLDERRHRLKSKHTVKAMKSKALKFDRPQEKGSVVNLDDAISSDQERDMSKVTSLAPARVSVCGEVSVTQIACGLHHSVVLLQNGDVYTFGSNQHGQLGLGDLTLRGTPTLVKLSMPAGQVAAGSNHTVILTVTGQVYTFGSCQKHQLGRLAPNTANEEVKIKEKNFRESPWFSVPGLIPNIGPKHGRRATWVGASGDQTYLKLDESLINGHTLARSSIVANKACIALIPSTTEHSSFKCLLINRNDGNCRSFVESNHVDLSNQSACLDPIYDVLWAHNPHTNQINCYNVVASEAQRFNSESFSMPDVLSPELALPVHNACTVTRSHAALHLLGCLDTLNIAQDRNLRVQEDDSTRQSVSHVYSKEDFSAVSRFESHGGGWGYSGHSIEAIRFMADTDILLGGFGLFGGRGEYTGKIKLFDIGLDGGDQETDGELITETEEMPYECGARQKYPMLFDEPVAIPANRWFVAWARVSGPSSDCGSSGQSVVTTEDQVVFYFKSSKKSNNGTDVNAGQIPQLLYKVVTPESQSSNRRIDQLEPIYILSKEFSRAVTPDCFQSLLQLLQWSWQTFKVSVHEMQHLRDTDSSYTAAVIDLERLVYISTATLRLMRTFISEVYPNSVPRKAPAESVKIAQCVAEVRVLLRRILSDSNISVQMPSRAPITRKLSRVNLKQEVNLFARLSTTILDECHQTFISCFHAFYPTSYLKWSCICELLKSMENATDDREGYDRLLAAVLAALCSPTVKATQIFPITCEHNTDLMSRMHAPAKSPENAASQLTINLQRYPILVEQMNSRHQAENVNVTPQTFREVLQQLLVIITKPVQQTLNNERVTYSPRLVANSCALLATIIAELSSQTTGTEAELQNTGGRVLQITPCRFTRTSQSRTWNTGNGSPDAICFSVDRPGIIIAGVSVYGGVGFYEYELECLDDQSGSSDTSHTQRWNSLELVRGTFGPDDCIGDVTELKFDRPIPIKENVKYALRLRNHGGRTSNGDGGLLSVKAPDGTTFTYSSCSLSFNGTNNARGQFPQILYYSTPQDSDTQQNGKDLAEMQARKSALAITGSIVKAAADLLKKAQEITGIPVIYNCCITPIAAVCWIMASSTRVPDKSNLSGMPDKTGRKTLSQPRRSNKFCLENLGPAYIISMLLPMVLAHIGPVATSDPKSAVQVISLIVDLLPSVASINNQLTSVVHPAIISSEQLPHESVGSTTSCHYAVVESDHPYKPATVSHYKVSFPDVVKWMSLEFDPQCGMAQAEDTLQLYVPSKEIHGCSSTNVTQVEENEQLDLPYWPIMRKLSAAASWPHSSIVLPGNEVIFSLETASDYIKDEKACFYGFKCMVIGYEWNRMNEDGMKHLEKELAYLGGLCASSLMKKDLILPTASIDEMDDDLEVADEIAQRVFHAHSALLNKGFALSHSPTIHQALDGVLPFSCQSNERSFLKDFVSCSSGTSGGRLARWLQPDSYVDPKQCEVLYNKDDMKCGWPTVITILTKDQYGDAVHVPNLKVDVKAVPIDKKERGTDDGNCKMARISKPDSLTFGGHPHPNLDSQYEITVKDKMCYNAITMMKAYENYSFEELRYMSPTIKRPSEKMMVRANSDSTYTANWTPGSVGWYSIFVTVDGFDLDEVYKIEVKETPQGLTPPTQNLVKKTSHQPNKLRKFVAKSSAGLRVRAHPSLQSEQIGIVNVNGTICFTDEMHNDDGVWVRLGMNAVKKYCQNGFNEAWCLQYNQHLGKTLLVPIDEPKSILDQIIKETVVKRVPDIGSNKEGHSKHRKVHLPTSGAGVYHVIKCGASGHNIRSRPSLKAPPVGMLVLSNQIDVTENVVNSEGIWIKLDKDSMRRYCFNTDGEAWSLSLTRSDVMYLQHETDMTSLETEEEKKLENDLNSLMQDAKGFDFSAAAQATSFSSFTQSQNSDLFLPGEPDGMSSGSASPFVFGSPESSPSNPFGMSTPPIPDSKFGESECENNSRLQVLQRWLKEEENRQEKSGSTPRDIPPELLGVSVKDLVKAIGESRANGNGVTPPRTPPGTPPRKTSRNSSPRPSLVPGSRESSARAAVSPLVSENWTGNPAYLRKSSPQTDNVGASAEEMSQSESLEDLSEIPKSPPSRPKDTIKTVIQTGTQTSPEDDKGHFNIGSSGPKEDSIHSSPKFMRKDRGSRVLRVKRERAQSPAPSCREKTGKERLKEPVKLAKSPSVAECLRAVFAAFLWHEGISHDAMACASFLKFHPNLPKQSLDGPRVEVVAPKPEQLTKEEKARQRHSVEVSMSSYLNIQPSENFAKSLTNANMNKNKMRKTSEAIKEECPVETKPAVDNTESDVTETVVIEGDLPPSLQHLVTLWEEIASAAIRVISQQIILPSPSFPLRRKADVKEKEKDKKNKKKKEWKQGSVERGNLFGEAAGSPFGGLEREALCELCGCFSPHPVTYHMKQAHPGCGGHAGGKGYNSGGNFCGGWAGNCGDGGVGDSSWYLICDKCRERYLKTKRQSNSKEKSKKSKNKSSPNKSSALPQLETYQIMTNNAMFLLDLACASDIIPVHSATPQKKSPYRNNMPSLNEHGLLDTLPFPHVNFQCLETLGAQASDLRMFNEDFILEESLRQSAESSMGRATSGDAFGNRLSANDLDEQFPSGVDSSGSISDGDVNRGRVFQRSISVGTTTTREWNRQEGDGRIIMTHGGSSLLCHPSCMLTRLATVIVDKNQYGDILHRPIMSFILQRHDLESLQLAMKQALRKAACRVYAMQALNWLLRSTTQPTALHDLLWCFVTALSPPQVIQPEDEEGAEKDEKKEHEHVDKEVGVCEHPLSDITVAGECVHPLLSAFHTLLQTISDLMMLLPMGSPLQQMAMRCWCLKFRQSDHLFLHRSHVFNNISKILSRSEEELGTDEAGSTMGDSFQVTSTVECLKDLSGSLDIKASSRQAMVGSLTDNSTETFWESGDEDRNKTKVLTVISGPKMQPRIVYVHIDNCRDLGNKVSSITFKSGVSVDEHVKLRYLEVESRFTGWVSCPVTERGHTVLRLELKGSDNTLRLRQIKVLGELEGESLQSGKLHSANVIQQKNCEAETLKVFRLLTSLVFGRLILSDSPDIVEEKVIKDVKYEPLKIDGNNDLKEHMVGILFSRSKLTHLQKQVCAHIVQAIRKEATRVREEWEALLCSKSLSMDELPKSSDAYCFEMLSMVLALSGSSVGRVYLAQQYSLLRDLLSLLHTGSARVQRQVTSLLRRVLPEVPPQTLANILTVPTLPPTDFSIVSEANKSPDVQEEPFDFHKMGILDVFLSCIAKALTVQMKVKGKETGKGITTITLATAIHPRDPHGARWWLRGCLTRKLAEVIIQLLKDMAAGKLSESWASVTKGAVAENILNLTKLDENYRTPAECLKTPTVVILWLALASLCVLDQDHVERLSSGQWVGGGDNQQAQPRPTCDNHDDGETLAIILCNICGNLCADCDRFLHLHRKTRVHQRQVFKEEEEAIKVDLHEGCGRTKLFWIMALADSKTLKAMVEFREGNRGKSSSGTTGTCRFCGTTSNTGLLAIGNVCADAECQDHARNACSKILSCSHMCGGINNESICLPCLHGCSGDASLKQDADDMCMVCFTEALACAPAIQLRCGHVFHLHCCRNVLTKRWAGPRITFGFSLCPICKENIESTVLKDLLAPVRALYEDVRRKALMRLEYEGLHKAEAITTQGARFYNDPAGFAMERYAYYVCYKCKKAYYGGEVRCDIEAGGGDDYDPTELVCGGCSDVSRAQMCPKHGTDFLEYKCRYCCSVAVFFCFGTTHFCNACHDDFQRVTNIPKQELPHCPAGPKAQQMEGEECPLHVQHPPTGEEFALGCGNFDIGGRSMIPDMNASD
uniref:RCR-type E3 ubiquitin transferase n=1 Tax=Strigamia maritima TaxID=126957 RepID=T1JCF5_STRMM